MVVTSGGQEGGESERIALINAQMVVWGAGFVTLTLCVNAPLIGSVLSATGLNRVSAPKLAIRRKAKRALMRFTAVAVNDLQQDNDEVGSPSLRALGPTPSPFYPLRAPHLRAASRILVQGLIRRRPEAGHAGCRLVRHKTLPRLPESAPGHETARWRSGRARHPLSLAERNTPCQIRPSEPQPRARESNGPAA